MNKQPYGNQAITAYLLGSLSADEAEQFDELSFTDEEFAAQLQAAENDLVDAYVNGELAGPELEQFESHYLASQMRRGKTEFARAFQKSAKLHAVGQPAASAAESLPVEEKSRRTIGEFFTDLFAGPRFAAKWGLAFATLLLVAIGGWLLVQNSRNLDQVDQAQKQGPDLPNAVGNNSNAETAGGPQVSQSPGEGPPAESEQDPERPSVAQQKQPQKLKVPERRSPVVASFVLTPQLRGSGQLQTLAIPAKTASVDLRLELEPNDLPSFRVALTDQAGGRAIWRRGALKPKGTGENRSLNIRIPAGLLKSGEVYMLNVSSDGEPDETFGNYSFKAVVK